MQSLQTSPIPMGRTPGFYWEQIIGQRRKVPDQWGQHIQSTTYKPWRQKRRKDHLMISWNWNKNVSTRQHPHLRGQQNLKYTGAVDFMSEPVILPNITGWGSYAGWVGQTRSGGIGWIGGCFKRKQSSTERSSWPEWSLGWRTWPTEEESNRCIASFILPWKTRLAKAAAWRPLSDVGGFVCLRWLSISTHSWRGKIAYHLPKRRGASPGRRRSLCPCT